MGMKCPLIIFSLVIVPGLLNPPAAMGRKIQRPVVGRQLLLPHFQQNSFSNPTSPLHSNEFHYFLQNDRDTIGKSTNPRQYIGPFSGIFNTIISGPSFMKPFSYYTSPPTPQTPEPVPTPEPPCSGGKCALPLPIPPELPCSGGKCVPLEPTCSGGKCVPPEPPCSGGKCALPLPIPPELPFTSPATPPPTWQTSEPTPQTPEPTTETPETTTPTTTYPPWLECLYGGRCTMPTPTPYPFHPECLYRTCLPITPTEPTPEPMPETTEPYASCETSCGICNNLSTLGGTIQSPHFPNKYSNSMNCTYRIGVTPGKVIQLTFGEFLVESDFDSLTIFDGAYNDSQQLVYLTGSYPPTAASSWTSSSNWLLIQFQSDSSITGRWEANYVAV